MATLLLAVAGCRGTESLAESFPYAVINGIQFELPWRVEAVQALQAIGPDGKITLKNGPHTVEVVDGHLRYNGKDYGPLKQGDRVKLTEQGVVSINGTEHK